MPEEMDGEHEDTGTVAFLPVDLRGVEVLRAARSSRRWVVLHSTYTVCTVLHIDDPVPWRYRRRVDLLGSDGVSFMEPGEVHTNLEISAPATFRVLFIDPDVVSGAAAELGLHGPVHFSVSQVSATSHPRLRRSLLALHRALERPATLLESESRFAGCLRLLLEESVERPATPPTELPLRPQARAVALARDYLDAHVATPVTLRELTEVSGAASRFQLMRSFAAAVGLPPHAYQLQRRIARSRSLLASGFLPARVAAELGFADQSHFTRHFNRVLGVGPGSYARAVRERKNVQDIDAI
jgi:AraC-like DNA-binding protein